jgi:hypothetical protein
VDITVYLPDELGQWAKGAGLNLSRLLRDEVKAERKSAETRAKISAGGFERVEVYVLQEDRHFAFQGRQLRKYRDVHGYTTAWLTPKGAIAIYNDAEERLSVYRDYKQLTESGEPGGLIASVAHALGEKYVEDLDI